MLLGSTILEIALGLALVYLLLAVICSTLNEWIAGILKLRAKTLQEGIANLLEDPEVKGLAKQFFAHPLVKGLTRQGKNSFPSYIPASTFTAALLDIILPPDPNAGPLDLLQIYQRIRIKLAEFSNSNSELAKTMLILLDQAGIDPKKVQDATSALYQLEQVRSHLLMLAQEMDTADVQNLQPLAESLAKFKELEVSLRQTEMSARSALLLAQENVERYFDQAMDRVSGWYKRRAQIIIVVLAVLVTAALNADTLILSDYLAKNDATRNTVTTMAEDYYRRQIERAQSASVVTAPTESDQVADKQSASSRTSASLNAPASLRAAAAITTTTPISPSGSISETLALLDRLNLPIGWKELPTTPETWLYKILGLLVTAIAVSLGAPFWFELLGKMINLRMTGKKPAETTPGQNTLASSVLAARLVAQPVVGSTQVHATITRSATTHDLAELARRALKYVDELKLRRPLTVPERDVAVAWMLMETTNQGIVTTPAEIMNAIDQAARAGS